MLEWWRYRGALAKAQAGRARTARAYELTLKASMDRKEGADEYNVIRGSARFEDDMHAEEISGLVTERLRWVINKRMLPMPVDEELWEYGRQMGTYTLTRSGIAEVRRTIREDTKASREALFEWVKIVGAGLAAVTGLAGALTGLVALLTKEIGRATPSAMRSNPVSRKRSW